MLPTELKDPSCTSSLPHLTSSSSLTISTFTLFLTPLLQLDAYVSLAGQHATSSHRALCLANGKQRPRTWRHQTMACHLAERYQESTLASISL